MVYNLKDGGHDEMGAWAWGGTFLGAQDAAHHVTVMITYYFGITTHQDQLLSRAAIYSWLYHMMITCKPHGATLIGATEFRHNQ